MTGVSVIHGRFLKSHGISLISRDRELDTEYNQMISQSCHVMKPIVTLNSEAQVSTPGWQYFMCVVTHDGTRVTHFKDDGSFVF